MSVTFKNNSCDHLSEDNLESGADYYDSVRLIKDNDIFATKYRITGKRFALRRTNLDTIDKIEFIANEIRLTRLLKHENLLPFLCSFVNDNELWTITPFAEYGSASDLSKPTGLPELMICFIIRDVLSALQYLHRRGIIHRSVRGSHIVVTQTGRSLLTGLKYSTNVMIDGKWQTAIHQYPRNAEPNLNWFAPEVLEQNLLGYNSKSDIYSLGITCCELANGCVPFEDLDPTEMLIDKLTANFPRPLDSTCEEITKISIEVQNMSEEVKQKYETYRNRTFSSWFHKFTVDLCLNFDPCERPSASQLLDHNFIKQTKKVSSCTNLLSLISNIKPLKEENIKNNGTIYHDNHISKCDSSDDTTNWNFP